MMPSRDAALDALNNRLAAARADPGMLLTDDALRDAIKLAAATDTTKDTSAAQALGWFHWNRWLSLPDREGHSDGVAAVHYFFSVYETSPASVPAQVQRAISNRKQGSAGSKADPAVANGQAARLFSLYQSNGELPALVVAIAMFREAVAAASGGHPDRAMYLSNLGNALRTLSERTGEANALAEAIQVGREAVAVTPSGHPGRARRLSNLGIALRVLSERTGEADALTEAVRVTREAVAATPNGHPDRPMYLSNLGIALRVLSERTGETDALTEAVQVTREAVAATPNGHPNRARRLSNLGNALAVLSERTGETDALTEAIQVGREAVAAAPDGHPDRAACLSNLRNVLRRVSERAEETDVPTEAVQVAREAVAATPNGHPDRARHLSNLGNALWALSERTRETSALTEAIRVTREAVAATPNGHPDRARHLSNLGNLLLALFERTGETDALTEAIQVGREAVAATPHGHPGRAGRLNNLGIALRTLEEANALTEAVQVAREAVATAPDGHPDRALYLSNLGIALGALSERAEGTDALIGGANALTEAVLVGREAVAAAPDGHPDRAKRLSSLAIALVMLFERTGEADALTEAVQVAREAVAATPGGHPHRAAYLASLALALGALSERTGEADALTEAVQVMREAVAIPDAHPGHAAHFIRLGIALHALFQRTGEMDALSEALVWFRAAGSDMTAAAPIRIRGWRNAAVVLAGRVGESAQDALAAAEAAAELLPQVTPRSLARVEREYQLSRVGSLAEVAAAAATAAGRPERAVELLEQTRGVLVADTVAALSSDLTRLREIAPGLAEEFQELRARLDTLGQSGAIRLVGLTGSDRGQDVKQERREARDLADARRKAQAAWDQLITRIRSVGGFADFLSAPSIRKLASQAHDGPIVFVYASSARCDALILTHDPHAPVRLVPLTALTETTAVEQTIRLLEARQNATDPLTEPASRMAAQGEILKVLTWTWDTITKPVLIALGHTATPSREESWPRLWWCPVGVLAYLPLHAAGHHSDLTAKDPALKANPRTVLDRVISSYTTTVRSLAYARTHPSAYNGKAVIVAVPGAPDTQPLPSVTAETTTLTRLLPDALVLTNPTRDTVLAALPSHLVAHFACHGSADWNDPGNSRLILRDHQTAPLTVADVSALNLNGNLAYLSACDTTVTSPRLADEAVHITGAFHLAGYQHVIGTLWPISDAAAHDITKDFYADLTGDGTTPPQTSRSAQALHHAIRRLRARYPQTPTLWAAHTHTGP